MEAHALSHGAGHAEEHAHPTPGVYLRVALVLFVLTALEVLAYELARRPEAPLHALVGPLVVPILIVLSAAKFSLVTMFYMHLRQDSKLFTNLFLWPMMIAAFLVVALMLLAAYWLKTSS